jgi:hypothetical protein
MNNFMVIERILRNQVEFFSEVRDNVDLWGKCRAMLISCITFFAIYGAVMGISSSVMQAISSFIKLPILFIVTFLICAPSLYFFNLLFGSKQTLLQYVALVLTAMTTTSVLLLSLAPVTVFFTITTSQYSFFKLLNVTFFAISGGMGLVFLRRGVTITGDTNDVQGARARQIVLVVWMLLYAFVGSQMAWTLSPFMGEPGLPFIILTQPGGNFWSDVFKSIHALLGI